MLDHWAEIVLRNLAWTGGWVVAAALLFMLFVSAIGGGIRGFTAEAQRAQRNTKTGQGVCNASACARCARRDEARKARRIAYFESVLKNKAVPDEPRRSRRVGPPNPRAGEPARAPRSRVDVTA